MIIGICGKKQTGKNSMASFIKKQLPDTKIKEISFAKPLKDFVTETFNIDKRNVWGSDADKSYPLCTWGEIFTGPCLVKYKKHDRDLLSAREIRQIVGTDVIRHGNIPYLNNNYAQEVNVFLTRKFGDNRARMSAWIDLAIMDIKGMKARKELDIAIITDVRFHNEVSAVKENNGLFTINFFKPESPHNQLVLALLKILLYAYLTAPMFYFLLHILHSQTFYHPFHPFLIH